MIPAATISSVRSASDLPALVAEAGIALRSVSGGYLGLCPFHSEKTPSFRVHGKGERRGRYHCFGCGARGDSITFAAFSLGYTLPRDYARTIHYLADRAGIALTDKPVSRLQVAVDVEDRACSAWWWRERWDVVRGQMDTSIDADPDFADVCGRLLRGIEAMSGADKLQQFRREVTSAERRAWRVGVAEDAAFAAAWVGLA